MIQHHWLYSEPLIKSVLRKHTYATRHDTSVTAIKKQVIIRYYQHWW